MIDLNMLEQSLMAISQIGKGESSFAINGVNLSLRVLTPDEELEVQKGASEVIKASKDEIDSISTMEYLDRFRLATLSYAIVEINGQDFRDVQFIETGDTLPNGKRVQIPKPQALKKVLSKFSRTILVGIFKKYTELVEKTEVEAEKYIEVTVEDLDTEISRLRDRIVELEKSKEERLKKEQDIINTQIKLAGQASKVALKEQPGEEPAQDDLEDEVQKENERLSRERSQKPPTAIPPVNA